MKTTFLKSSYDKVSFLRHNLADLFISLNLSVDDFSILDSQLKSLLISIDDEILRRQNIKILDPIDVPFPEVEKEIDTELYSYRDV